MNKVYSTIENNLLLKILRNSFISLMPITIISSFFILIVNFPIPTFTRFMEKNFNLLWTTALPSIPNAFNNLIGLFILISIAYNYCKIKGKDYILYITSTLFAYFIFLPIESFNQLIDSLGSQGIFFSMICALMTCGILTVSFKKKRKINLHSSVPKEVAESFEYLLPLLGTTLVLFFVKLVLVIFKIENPSSMINGLIQVPITNLGSTLPAVIIINLGITLLWFFGFNGSYLFNSVMNPIYFSLNMENLLSITNGEVPPNIITGTFQSLFINYGGSGSTLALTLAILFFSKNSDKKSIAKVSLIPSLFNINEPIIYGLPILLNFRVFIPFILCPAVNTIIAYFSMSIGIVAKTNGIQIPWTTPPIISGFLASGVSGAFLQMALIVLNIMIYAPFIRTKNKGTFIG
ncbi:PTS sugar transporter subunit IIC [Enterococcus mundtii]|uniref:PTS sugar transporter subunit IIC n=1 Tax=Enterococcus mundtii TaxID=53346 RepID=UPI0008248F64|nr:PTS transporter subunit EIIC [Enterococcus mundtii]